MRPLRKVVILTLAPILIATNIIFIAMGFYKPIGTIIPPILLIIGASLNTIVLAYNGMKMPVLGGVSRNHLNTHKNLTSKTKFKMLADIHTLDFHITEEKRYVIRFSIGDALMYIGMMGLVYNVFL